MVLEPGGLDCPGPEPQARFGQLGECAEYCRDGKQFRALARRCTDLEDFRCRGALGIGQLLLDDQRTA